MTGADARRRTFAINRSRLLEEVLRERGWVSVRDVGADADFSMWDEKSEPHTEGPSSCRLQCLTRADMAKVDNKKQLWVRCRERAAQFLPPTFVDLPAAERAAREDAGGIWFLKKSHTAGGIDIVVGDWDEVRTAWAQAEKPRDWILQRGVRDMLLAEGGRKVTLRLYLLWLPSGAAHLWQEGLAIVHGAPADGGGEPTREAHIDHKGCPRRRLSEEPYAEDLWGPLRQALASVCGCYRGEVNAAADPTRYHLFGADVVVSRASESAPLCPVLIEFNQWPNMSIRSDPIGRAVKRELFEDLYSFLIAPTCLGSPPAPGRFVEVLSPT
eukprot:TRINITY_DN65430_c0_g1_i1.p1 TRINITY_DN65430_c0_g1~~TRINITY_DN65430_c0_g1_i1.p1  ORF type:complete len:352 (+),score=98.79 TRINITY_DN65430_c0_g1_i1:77-1057(+)